MWLSAAVAWHLQERGKPTRYIVLAKITACLYLLDLGLLVNGSIVSAWDISFAVLVWKNEIGEVCAGLFAGSVDASATSGRNYDREIERLAQLVREGREKEARQYARVLEKRGGQSLQVIETLLARLPEKPRLQPQK